MKSRPDIRFAMGLRGLFPSMEDHVVSSKEVPKRAQVCDLYWMIISLPDCDLSCDLCLFFMVHATDDPIALPVITRNPKRKSPVSIALFLQLQGRKMAGCLAAGTAFRDSPVMPCVCDQTAQCKQGNTFSCLTNKNKLHNYSVLICLPQNIINWACIIRAWWCAWNETNDLDHVAQ